MKRNNRFFSVIVACGLASVFADALAQALGIETRLFFDWASRAYTGEVVVRMEDLEAIMRGWA